MTLIDSSLAVAACEGKQRFASFGEARAVLRRLQRRHKRAYLRGSEPYRCPVCGGWHLGRSVQRKGSF